MTFAWWVILFGINLIGVCQNQVGAHSNQWSVSIGGTWSAVDAPCWWWYLLLNGGVIAVDMSCGGNPGGGTVAGQYH